MKLICLLAIPVFAFATDDSPSGTRITPPTIRVVSPQGVARGATLEMTIEGYNLAKASAIYFSEPGIKAKITRIKELPDVDDVRLGGNGTPLTVDLGPLPTHNQITAELEVSPDAKIGPVDFRVLTPLGTSPMGRFLIEPYYGEAPDREPNNTPEEAFETYLPAILVGTISKPGDVDYYKIKATAGEKLVFENGARLLTSSLTPVISIYDENQTLLKEFTEDEASMTSVLSYDFAKAGPHYLKIADYEQNGSAKHFYRIKVGRLPIVTSAFPLGLQQGKTVPVTISGYNLISQTVEVKSEPSADDPDAVILRPHGKGGLAFDELKLALGKEPEIIAAGKGVATVQYPVTINGRLTQPEHSFRFHARKGQKLLFEVNANRLGSPLDSALEITDLNNRAIEQATVRAVLETSTTLSDRDSAGRGLRITSPAGFAPGDYMMVGGEIMKVQELPLSPDNDFLFYGFGKQRLAYFDTTSEAHGMDAPAYKVQIHPPGTKFAPNGLPLIHLMYRNDDGGPGWGKDSRLHFAAPADGDYIVHLKDVRGMTGQEYAYRLTVREPVPDFRLSVTPGNPNVPRGGRIPLTVNALRLDDYDGPIEVKVKDLPPGLHATEGVIQPGQTATTLLLSADENAQLDAAAPLEVVDAKGRIAGAEEKLKLIALMPKADIQMTTETREVVLEPGSKAHISVSIKRNNGFGGRVPVEVLNLPPEIHIIDVGLNGVLINEDEERRQFTLEAMSNAQPTDQPIIVSGLVETRSTLQNLFAGEPIRLVVKAANTSQRASR